MVADATYATKEAAKKAVFVALLGERRQRPLMYGLPHGDLAGFVVACG
jgi:hypothetical protein